jgi:hypothetical protein
MRPGVAECWRRWAHWRRWRRSWTHWRTGLAEAPLLDALAQVAQVGASASPVPFLPNSPQGRLHIFCRRYYSDGWVRSSRAAFFQRQHSPCLHLHVLRLQGSQRLAPKASRRTLARRARAAASRPCSAARIYSFYCLNMIFIRLRILAREKPLTMPASLSVSLSMNSKSDSCT